MSNGLADAGASVRSLYDETRAVLEHADVERPADEARDIIAAVLEVPRFWPVTNADYPVGAATADAVRHATRQRSRGAPFAYAVGRAAFRSYTLRVDQRVLIPRQETEELVDAVLALDLEGTAIDVGTGSGAIAIALAAEGRFSRVIATDISHDALAVARDNVTRCASLFRAPVELRQGAGLTPVRDAAASLLVSNPPYIATAECRDLPASVRDWEPPLALYSGVDGMPVTRSLISGARDVLAIGGVLALEVDCRRATLVSGIIEAEGSFTDITVKLDLSGRARIVLARRQR